MDLKSVRLESRYVLDDLRMIPQVMDDPLDAAIMQARGAFSQRLPLRQESSRTIYMNEYQAVIDVKTILADTEFIKFFGVEYPLGKRTPVYHNAEERRATDTSDLTEDASSGQKYVKPTDGTKFMEGEVLRIADDNASELNTVNAISGNTVTMVNDLANSYLTGDNAVLERAGTLVLKSVLSSDADGEYAKVHWGKQHTLNESTSTIEDQYLQLMGKGSAAYVLQALSRKISEMTNMAVSLMREFQAEIALLKDNGPKAGQMRFVTW